MKKIYLIFCDIIVNPIRRNLSLSMFFLGVLVIFFGAFNIGIDPKYSDVLLKVGSAILGAGVFAGVMKSAQFIEIFQKCISDVLYDPDRIENQDVLPEKWAKITKARLKAILPSTYDMAMDAIEKRYFDDELDYHFEDYEATYDVVVDKRTGAAKVTSTIRANIVISPGKEDPVFEQKIKCDSPAQLTSLIINSKTIDVDNILTKTDATEQTLRFELNKYSGESKKIKIIRTFVTQQAKDEPYIAATLSRFVKGAVIRAKITTGYKLRFLGMGIQGYDVSTKPDGDGYCRWTLAQPDSLLMPGQGYTLVYVSLS